MKHFRIHACAAAASLALLSACGGGSSNSTVLETAQAAADAIEQALASRTVIAPTITSQPASLTVTVGASATFIVGASGTSLTYQWYKDGTAIAGATASSYNIATVASGDAGSYTVKVSNSAGSKTSSAATLTVSATDTGSSALTTSVVSAAQAFVATLGSSQQSTLQLAWNLDTARHWSNLPASLVSRNGLSWGSLSSTQQAAARTMIATALSATGNTLHIGLQMADNYLNANGGGSSYGEGNYYIAFLGTPSTSGFWLLQLTGHHLTYNIAFNGSYKSPTPLFMGIEPKASFTYSGTTYDPEQAQREAWSNLGAAMTSYSGAKLSGTYSDLLFGANGSGNIDGSCPRDYASVTEHGLLYSSLSATDQALAQAVIKAYVATQASEYADELLSVYLSDTALASTYVAYSGTGTVTTKGNYFRIEGPRVWIELTVQNGVIFNTDIHYHGIWRDKSGDYGGKCTS